MRVLLILTGFVLLLGGWPTGVLADSWGPAEPELYYSENRQYRILVEPRELESSLAYFADAVEELDNPGQAENGNDASSALFQRLDDKGDWQTVWQGHLVNDVAPVEALVSNNGEYVVTLDNWHSTGYGDDAIVIYDKDGKVVRQMALTDFLPEDLYAQLPRSISSIQWREEAILVGNRLLVEISSPDWSYNDDAGFEQGNSLPISISLSDGTVSGTDTEAFRKALIIAKKRASQAEAGEQEWLGKIAAPLDIPKNSDAAEWRKYLKEAYRRLNGEDSYIDEFYFNSAGDWKSWKQQIAFQASIDENSYEDAFVIAGETAEAILAAVAPLAEKIPANTLEDKTFVLFGNEETGSKLAALLKPSGAAVRVEPLRDGIPQRADRIPGTPEFEAREEEWDGRAEEAAELASDAADAAAKAAATAADAAAKAAGDANE